MCVKNRFRVFGSGSILSWFRFVLGGGEGRNKLVGFFSRVGILGGGDSNMDNIFIGRFEDDIVNDDDVDEEDKDEEDDDEENNGDETNDDDDAIILPSKKRLELFPSPPFLSHFLPSLEERGTV